jgi:hypothetical protein
MLEKDLICVQYLAAERTCVLLAEANEKRLILPLGIEGPEEPFGARSSQRVYRCPVLQPLIARLDYC